MHVLVAAISRCSKLTANAFEQQLGMKRDGKYDHHMHCATSPLTVNTRSVSLLLCRLEFTDIYNEFLSHFEAKIQTQIIELGGSDAEFQHQCSEALAAANEGSARSFFIAALLATTEYSRFYALMMGVAREALRK
jgi:The ARF-like 2 binding protein BART